ncbi:MULTISPECIES: helix-turn-helix domain-containing protein [unclassified Paenibacillus]|uniref:helix-turn-helix domain-containing protein n=1 Tax=unclassified Paenibacillus TaxID=185978 RepID=UPI00096FFD5F|nr:MULTISPECIES: helix-turn-helix transcriptional regulator [unclassified Paenibacillus]OMC63202.1 transcriptional regulator [Paenibacillus sp. FSL H7-0326]
MENMQLARRIRAFRKLKGFTQQTLAEQSGISLAMLGMFERGTRKPTDEQLAVIAEALEITIVELQR